MSENVENEEFEQEKEEKLRLETISMSNAVTTRRGGTAIHTMTIIGQVEGHYLLGGGQKSTKYEQIIPLLVSVEESEEVDGLLLILNTVGGDVEAGLAIAEMVASMSKPTVSLVLGGGHSIGVPLAVCADRSFIVPSATMTIHPVRTNGLVISSPQTFYGFERMQDRIVDFIVRHSGIAAGKLRELMMKPDEMATDIGTVLEGREAVSLGLIDEIGGLKEAICCLHTLIDAGDKAEREPGGTKKDPSQA